MWLQAGWMEWGALLGALLAWRWSLVAARQASPTRERFWVCVAGLLFFAGFVRMWVVEPFEGYGPSMRPTLAHESTILVDKSAYGWRLPVLEWWVWKRRAPQPGEVVILKSPLEDGRAPWLVKRVVAQGGDVVRVEGERVFVNDVPLERAPPPGRPLPSSFLTNVWMAETMGHRHRVWLQESLHVPSSHIVTWEVPPGYVFLVGDNRRDSLDSRVFGPVPASSVIGQVFAVWEARSLRRVDTPDA